MAVWFRLSAKGGLAPKCRCLGHCERLSVQDVQLISAERDGDFASPERWRLVCEKGLGYELCVRRTCHDAKIAADERQQSSHLAPQDERKACAGTLNFRALRTSGSAASSHGLSQPCWREPPWTFEGVTDLRSGDSEAGVERSPLPPQQAAG